MSLDLRLRRFANGLLSSIIFALLTTCERLIEKQKMKRRTNPQKHQSSSSYSVTPKQLEQAVEKAVDGRLATIEQTIIQQTSYSGPLPPSDETANYERICPGFTDRWIKMSEIEQQKRYEVVERRDKYEMAYRVSALGVSSIITLCLVGGGMALLYLGKTMEGFASIGVAAAAIIGSLLYRTAKQKEGGQEAKKPA